MPDTRLPIVFYRTASGAEPVRLWLRALPVDDRRAIGFDLLRAQENWPLAMPLCRSLGGGLWEIRSDLPSRRIARVLFCIEGSTIYALHGYIKKTQKAPESDIVLAKKRMKEVTS